MMFGMMKLLGGTKSKIAKSKNVLYLEITEVALVHCDIVNNDYQQDSRVLYRFVSNNCLVNYWIFHPEFHF